MKELTYPMVLQLVGVGIIIAEIIIPSGGILAVMAAFLFLYSLYIVFQGFSPWVGMAFVLADIFIISFLIHLGLKIVARSPVTLSKTLSRGHGVVSQSSGLGSYVGKHGISKTDLRPAGFALIEGKKVDVITRGEYIQKNIPIVVYAVTGNQIIVRENNKTRAEGPGMSPGHNEI